MNRDGAEAMLEKMKKTSPDLFKNFDQALFDRAMDAIFNNPPFDKVDQSIGATKWPGTITHHGVKEASKKKISIRKESRTLDVQVLSSHHVVKYNLLKSDTPPDAMVICLYTGSTRKSADHDDRMAENLVRVKTDKEPSIWTVDAHLWDEEMDILQWDQLKNDKNMRDTHLSFLSAVSQLVQDLRRQFPQTKIFLEGESFGGFFGISYAVLQSIFTSSDSQLLSEVYKSNVVLLLKEMFPTGHIAPVDGVVTHAAGLGKFYPLFKDGWKEFKYLKVPTLLNFNYEDNNVKLLSQKDQIHYFPKALTEISVNREGAYSYGAELKEEDNIDQLGGHSRGHFPAESFVTAAINFITRICEGKNPIAFHSAVQERRHSLYINVPRTDQDKSSFLTYQNRRQFLANMADLGASPGEDSARMKLALRKIDAPYLLAFLLWVMNDQNIKDSDLATLPSDASAGFKEKIANIQKSLQLLVQRLEPLKNSQIILETALERWAISPSMLRREDISRILGPWILTEVKKYLSEPGQKEVSYEKKQEIQWSIEGLYVRVANLEEILYKTPGMITWLDSFKDPAYLACLDQARKIVYHKLLEATTTKGLWKGAVKSLANKTSGSVA
jgi:hypothetical protein